MLDPVRASGNRDLPKNAVQSAALRRYLEPATFGASA